MERNLRLAAVALKIIEDDGAQATIRLTDLGFLVQVSRDFCTKSRLVTFEDVALGETNVLVHVLSNMATGMVSRPTAAGLLQLTASRRSSAVPAGPPKRVSRQAVR